MCDRASPESLDRINRSRAWSPERACAEPTADLNSCSNLAWSCAVMNDNLMLGILLDFAGTGGGACCEEVPLKESAICDEVMPVGCGRCGWAGGACWGGGAPV